MQLWDHILWAINLTIHNLRWYGTYVSQKQWDNVNNIPNSVPGTELISSQEQLLYEQTISMYWKCVKSSKHPLELLLQTHLLIHRLPKRPTSYLNNMLTAPSINPKNNRKWVEDNELTRTRFLTCSRADSCHLNSKASPVLEFLQLYVWKAWKVVHTYVTFPSISLFLFQRRCLKTYPLHL